MTVALLILHGLVAVALLGAVTHQSVSVVREALAARAAGRDGTAFLARYARANKHTFTIAVAVLFATTVALGAIIYPAYRIDVRIPLEELGLPWAVGLFEIKEHWGAIGLGTLPLYVHAWRAPDPGGRQGLRIGCTLVLAVIVWNDFLVGHVLNNIRGLG